MVTNDELKKLAALAKLSLDGENAEMLANDIGSILDFANTVSEAAVREPETVREERLPLREDVVKPSLPVNDILANAGEQQDGFFIARNAGGGCNE